MAEDANTSPFTISIVGDVTEEKWYGDFSAKKRLSHRDQLRKDQLRRELLGSQAGAPTERALSTAMILSELSVRLTKTPSWWTEKGEGLDFADDNIIGTVFDAAMKVERDAADEKKKRAEEALKAMREEAKLAESEAK